MTQQTDILNILYCWITHKTFTFQEPKYVVCGNIYLFTDVFCWILFFIWIKNNLLPSGLDLSYTIKLILENTFYEIVCFTEMHFVIMWIDTAMS